MEKPFFSIIVPVYNVPQDYFNYCIKSIINQSFQNFELILINDGSTDNSGRLCDEYATSDNRIRVIHQENQGVSVARNKGIEVAVADWIIFVDADDWIEHNAFERLKKYLMENKCDILLFNLTKEYAEKQQKMNYGLENARMYTTSDVDTREFFYRRAMQPPNLEKVRYCPIYYSCDKVFSKAFLIDNCLRYPKGLPKSEDKVFILDCFEKLNNLYYVDDVLYHYRINSASVCNRYSENADIDRIHLAQLLEEISGRLDRELARLKKDPSYNLITKDYIRFIFGIITDVLFLKYYHPDYPYRGKKRRIEVKKFINTEPYKSSIRKSSYKDLTNKARVKKFLLSFNLVSLFYYIRSIQKKIMKKIAED